MSSIFLSACGEKRVKENTKINENGEKQICATYLIPPLGIAFKFTISVISIEIDNIEHI